MTSPAVKLNRAAAEVALGEAQSVLALVQDEERRGRLADLVAAVQDGELGEEESQALEEIIELGLSTGRIRGVYGPEGEQAALKTYRKLPRGKQLAESTRDVTGALAALEGKALELVKVQAAGPGAYLLSIGVEGLELTVRLDRSGARLHSVGV
jgi:hypothetical protein